MTAVRENDELHRLVDRLTPGQARRLLALAQAAPALAAAASGEEAAPRPVLRAAGPVAEPGPDGDAIQRFRSFVGIIDSGRGDLSEQHEESSATGLQPNVTTIVDTGRSLQRPTVPISITTRARTC